jgi:glycosyltransferase involved in cell wall biosynthesis
MNEHHLNQKPFILLSHGNHGSAPALTLTHMKELQTVGRLGGVVVSEDNELLTKIVAYATNHSIRIQTIPTRQEGRSLYQRMLALIVIIVGIARTSRVRDVLVPTFDPKITVVTPVLRMFNIRVHAGIHDFEPHEGDREWFIRVMNLLICACCFRVLFYSRSQYDRAQCRWPWFAHRYRCLRLPTEYQREHTEMESLRHFEFLFFGRLERYKGLELLLEAFTNVRRIRPDVTLHIAGAGSYQCRALEEANDPNISKSIGYVPNNRLPEIFLGAKVIVLPYSSATQSGVAHLGAVYGMNVVCTPCDGLIEQAKHNPRMRFSSDFSPQALARAMMISLDEWTPEIGRQSLQIASGIIDLE